VEDRRLRRLSRRRIAAAGAQAGRLRDSRRDGGGPLRERGETLENVGRGFSPPTPSERAG